MTTTTSATVSQPSHITDLLDRESHPDFPETYNPKTGLKVERTNTTADTSVYDQFEYRREDVVISDARTGKVSFESLGYEAPVGFTQTPRKIAASKYARKTLVPQFDLESGAALVDDNFDPVLGPEQSFKLTVSRIANHFMFVMQKDGYFASREDAVAWRDEYAFLLLSQRAANNSPVWFNTGVKSAYGIVESSDGNFYWDPELGKAVETPDKYHRTNASACYINRVDDELTGSGSILDLIVREGRLFKGGSGSGANVSSIRAKHEGLTGGGTASGVMSFLEPLDVSAGAIKSGGTTRRAAKMVVLNIDHPEVNEFVWCKAKEERKVPFLLEVTDADGNKMFPLDWEAENGVYRQLKFQNANHSVRVMPGFMQALEADSDWNLLARRDKDEDGNPRVMDTVKARDLWTDIATAAWESADPGIQFDDLTNDWNTVLDTERIVATNPCSEYNFVDDTACNLASLNLVKFFDQDNLAFKVEEFEAASRIVAIGLEAAIACGCFPDPKIAERTHIYRTVGAGWCNGGAMLMRAGIGYDTDEGRAVLAAVTALLHTTTYATSSELAAAVGACEGFDPNKDSALRVLRNHARAAIGIRDGEEQFEEFEELTVAPRVLNHDVLNSTTFASLSDAVVDKATEMVDKATENGLRNMQGTVLAPTGTIGLLMDADTTGIEPVYSLVAFKTLAGGGSMLLVNESVPFGLRALGYDESVIDAAVTHVVGTRTLVGDTPINLDTLAAALAAKDLPTTIVEKVEAGLSTAMSLEMAAGKWLLDADQQASLGLGENDTTFLGHLGFTADQIERSDLTICGHHAVDGAPGVREEHLPVFDAASPGRGTDRAIHWRGHVGILGATAPFLSGSASKTVNLPNWATVEDIEAVHNETYAQGIKCVAVYRDGSKQSQPLSSREKVKAGIEDETTDLVAEFSALLEAENDRLVESLRTSGWVKADEVVAAETASVDAELARLLNERSESAAVKELLASFGEVPEGMSPTAFYGDAKPQKFRLPSIVTSVREKLSIGGQDVFLTHGQYADGTCGEIFLKLSKEGGTLEGLCSAFATSVSMGLQRGVPLEEYVSKFRGHRFEPNGVVGGHPNLKMAESIIDGVFRILGYRYLGLNTVQVKDPVEVIHHAPTALQGSLPVDKVEAAKPMASVTTLPKSNGGVATAAAPKVEAVEDTDGEPDAPLQMWPGSDPLAGPCPACGEKALKPNGSCHVCLACATPTGCS